MNLTTRFKLGDTVHGIVKSSVYQDEPLNAKATNLAAAGSIGRSVQISGADAFAAALLPIVRTLQSAGATTLDAITRGLNARGVRTARGARWHVSSVANLLARTKSLADAR